MKPRKHTFPVISHDVYDGDTVKAVFDTGFYGRITLSGRIHGIDTPEIRTTDPTHKKAGLLVKKVVQKWFDDAASTGHTLMFHSVTKDKFSGRAVGDFYILESNHSLAQYMLGRSVEVIDGGICKVYSGGKKRRWTPSQLENCIKTTNIILMGQS